MPRDEFLQPSYLCESDREAVQVKAEVVAGGSEGEEAARKLFRWVRDEYVWDFTKIVGAERLLEQDGRKAMSFSKSNLLAALLRSQGIPARFNLVHGIYHDDHLDRDDHTVHAPVEVYLDGEWVTADPAFGEATREFREVSEFGEETWKELESSEKRAEMPRKFVLGYNYVFRFVHPKLRSLRKELRECQEF